MKSEVNFQINLLPYPFGSLPMSIALEMMLVYLFLRTINVVERLDILIPSLETVAAQ